MACLDSLSRPINYLRISVTDRCNLRCMYCMPAEGVARKFPHAEMLSYEEIARVVRAAAGLGISKIRLTGGEPLARLHLPALVGLIAQVPGVDDVSMTTNGILLPLYVEDLKDAGLHRVNVSLDTLRPERYHRITRMGELDDALAGLQAAERAGLEPLKVNMVVMRGVNDDEVVDFARLTLDRAWHVRYIEVMPMGETPDVAALDFVPTSAVRARIEEVLGPLQPAKSWRPGNGPARYYHVDGAAGSIGFISPVTEHFCYGCNRLRLTADGLLRPCLLSDSEVDLRVALRQGAGQEELQALLQSAIAAKPARHHLGQGEVPLNRQMSQIGG